MTPNTSIPAMTLAQFAIQNGMTTTGDVDAHIHASLRSKPQTKTFQRWYDRTLADLQDQRDATKRAYQAAIDAGQIREPTRKETIIANSRGHEDRPSTHAARRLCEKKGWQWGHPIVSMRDGLLFAGLVRDRGPATARGAIVLMRSFHHIGRTRAFHMAMCLRLLSLIGGSANV